MNQVGDVPGRDFGKLRYRERRRGKGAFARLVRTLRERLPWARHVQVLDALARAFGARNYAELLARGVRDWTLSDLRSAEIDEGAFASRLRELGYTAPEHAIEPGVLDIPWLRPGQAALRDELG